MVQSRERVREQLRHLSQQLKQKDRPVGVRQAATKVVMEEAEQLCTAVSAAVGASEESKDEALRRERQAVQAGVAVLQRLTEQTKQVLDGNPHVKKPGGQRVRPGGAADPQRQAGQADRIRAGGAPRPERRRLHHRLPGPCR